MTSDNHRNARDRLYGRAVFVDLPDEAYEALYGTPPLPPLTPKGETSMKFLNLNAIQTYLTAIMIAIPAIMVSTGCTQDAATHALSCAGSFIPPQLTAYIIGGLGFLKLVIVPAIQSGGWFRNLFDPKVPVTAAGAAGTVHPDDVVKPGGAIVR